jgi:hypothetical protein
MCPPRTRHNTFIHNGSTALCPGLFSLFRDPIVGGIPWTGISPFQGRYLHTGQYKHRMYAHRYPCLEWDSKPQPPYVYARGKFGHPLIELLLRKVGYTWCDVTWFVEWTGSRWLWGRWPSDAAISVIRIWLSGLAIPDANIGSAGSISSAFMFIVMPG